MPPIKIKLSLTSSGSQVAAPDAATPAGSKATGKDEQQQVVKPEFTISASSAELEDSHNLDDQPIAGPSRLPSTTPSVDSGVATEALESMVPGGQAGVPAVETLTRRVKGNKSTPVGRPKGKTKAAKGKGKRPSAIPTRLLSSTPSTPKPVAPLPLTDTPSPGGDVSVKIEEGEDMYMAEGSPSTPQQDYDSAQTPGTADNGTPFTGDTGTPLTGQKTSARWMRIKRPMRELATKILTDLNRRDEVCVFE